MFSKNIAIAIPLWSCLAFNSAIAEENQNENTDQSSENTGTTTIEGIDFGEKEIVYERIDDVALFEGDIIVGHFEAVPSETTSSEGLPAIAITNAFFRTKASLRWLDNTVPYQFKGNVSERTRRTMRSAIAHWEKHTYLRFVERNASNASDHPDYIHIVSDKENCSSKVGRQGGGQTLNVFDRCGIGPSIHEIGHAIGLFHEQSREDRDRYVEVKWDNIEPDKLHNFNQHILDGEDLGPYDYHSIMHYGSRFFAKDETKPTLVPKQAGVSIGHRSGLSDLDIQAINAMYPKRPLGDYENRVLAEYYRKPVSLDASYVLEAAYYAWDMGDGVKFTSHQPNIDYTYAERGEYRVNVKLMGNVSHVISENTINVHIYGDEELNPLLIFTTN